MAIDALKVVRGCVLDRDPPARAPVVDLDLGSEPLLEFHLQFDDGRRANHSRRLLSGGALGRSQSYGLFNPPHRPTLRNGPLGDVDLTGFDWLIVGGESGPGFRKMEMEWAREALALCEKYGLAFFFKQDSGHRNEMRPWLIDKEGGRWQWQQYPDQRTQPRRVPSVGGKDVQPIKIADHVGQFEFFTM